MPEQFEEAAHRELQSIKRDLDAISKRLDILPTLAERVSDLTEDIHGVPTRGIDGIRVRLSTVTTLVDAMAKEREAMNNKIKGLLLGLGFTSVASFSTLAAVVRLIFGGP